MINSKLIYLPFLLTVSVLFAACTTSPDTTAQTGTLDTVSESLSYPLLYTQANLPQYANATLTDLGDQTTSLKDGLKLTLTSPDDVATIATYFETTMTELGWDVPSGSGPQNTLYAARYTKANRFFQISITRLPSETSTSISITYAEE